MSQVLHILRKDLRHNWPEATVSLALLLAYVADQPRQWQHAPAATRFLEVGAKAIPVLLVISWAYLVVQLVHEESLVGDRQFWITRPYEWPKLLGAKLLEIFLLIHVPFFLAQIVLLKLDRFAILKNLAGLVGIQVGFAMLFVIAILFGVLTTGLGSAVLAVLGGFVVLLGVVAVANFIPNADLASTGAIGTVQMILLFGSCIGIILLQYTKRKTGWSWIWLGSAIVVVTLVFVVAPNEKLIEREFPIDPSKPVPAEFKFLAATIPQEDEPLPTFARQAYARFTIPISGVPEHTAINIRAQRLDIETEKGEKWSTNWQQNFGTVLLAGEQGRYLTFEIKKDAWERFAERKVKARLQLALNMAAIEETKAIPHLEQEFTIPQGARCTSSLDGKSIYCQSVLGFNNGLYARSESASTNCPGSKSAATLEDEQEETGEYPAEFMQFDKGGGEGPLLSPIHESTISLHFVPGAPGQELGSAVCSLKDLKISAIKYTYSSRVAIELGEIQLKDYAIQYGRHSVRKKSKK